MVMGVHGKRRGADEECHGGGRMVTRALHLFPSQPHCCWPCSSFLACLPACVALLWCCVEQSLSLSLRLPFWRRAQRPPGSLLSSPPNAWRPSLPSLPPGSPLLILNSLPAWRTI